MDFRLTAFHARAIYESGFTSIYHVSRAKTIDIVRALQRTMDVDKQYRETTLGETMSKNLKPVASLKNANVIVNCARKIMKRRYLEKARQVQASNA